MDRLNIDYSFITEFGDLFRPSMKETVSDTLYRNNTNTVKEVCQMEEKQFRGFPFATDDVVKRVKERMYFHGLRFGMTLDELNAYQDADFLLLHQESESDGSATVKKEQYPNIDFNKIINDFKASNGNFADVEHKSVKRNEEEKSAFENILKEFSPYARDFCDDLRYQINTLVLDERVNRTLQKTYFSQPWWVKLFCKPSDRLHTAIRETLLLCSTPIALKHQVRSMQIDLLEEISKTLEKEEE